MASRRAIRSGTIVLYPEVLFKTGATVRRWSQRVAIRIDQAVTNEAPERTANLKYRIATSERRAGPKQVTITLKMPDYARYVLGGTPHGGQGGIAVGKQSAYGRGFPGAVRGKFYSRPTFVRDKPVAGQDANNFVQRGMDRVKRVHPSIGGMDWSKPADWLFPD